MARCERVPWGEPEPGVRTTGRRSVVGGSAEPSKAKVEEELVRSHLPLVNYMVSEIAGRIPRHVCRTDLVSAGMAGLAQAAKSYQPDRGVTFQRFASSRSGAPSWTSYAPVTGPAVRSGPRPATWPRPPIS